MRSEAIDFLHHDFIKISTEIGIIESFGNSCAAKVLIATNGLRTSRGTCWRRDRSKRRLDRPTLFLSSASSGVISWMMAAAPRACDCESADGFELQSERRGAWVDPHCSWANSGLDPSASRRRGNPAADSFHRLVDHLLGRDGSKTDSAVRSHHRMIASSSLATIPEGWK